MCNEKYLQNNYSQQYCSFESIIERVDEIFQESALVDNFRTEKYSCSDYARENIEIVR